jgi:hypothetical protein
VTIMADHGVSCLAIQNITADDSGKYVVSVENSLGADCQFASVAVEGAYRHLFWGQYVVGRLVMWVALHVSRVLSLQLKPNFEEQGS